MQHSPRVHVTVDLDVTAEPLSGTVRVGDRPAQPFVGWIELAGLIERARAAPHEADVGRSPP